MTPRLRGHAVRDHILATADDLFYTAGIQAVGVDLVAARAGVAKSTLYRWFPTKDDLVVAFLEWRDQRYWARWNATAERYPTDPHSELAAHLRWIRDYLAATDFRGCPFLNTAAEDAGIGEPARAVCRRHKGELRRRLRDLAARVEPERADELADHLLLLIDGAYATARIFGATGPQDQLERAGRAILATGDSR